VELAWELFVRRWFGVDGLDIVGGLFLSPEIDFGQDPQSPAERRDGRVTQPPPSSDSSFLVLEHYCNRSKGGGGGRGGESTNRRRLFSRRQA
jgi:hypothetical protein